MKSIRFCNAIAWLLAGTSLVAQDAHGQELQTVDAEQRLARACEPPAEFAGDGGNYRSPLLFADGWRAESAEDWKRRRAEILKSWHRRLGEWPPLIDKPNVELLELRDEQGYMQYKVRIQVSPQGQSVDGYLLVPRGDAPFPAVLVPFYEPLTSIGRGKKHCHGGICELR